MATVEKSVVVDRPLSTVYNQWTQFEDFPAFMQGVESVTQLDERRLHWRSSVAGVEREWEAEIVDQTPDQRISWVSTSGFQNNGMVTFAPASPTDAAYDDVSPQVGSSEMGSTVPESPTTYEGGIRTDPMPAHGGISTAPVGDTLSGDPMGTMPSDSVATRVTLRLEFEEEGMAEKIADALGIVDRRVEGDLERFKEFIEGRGNETGAWRGEV